MPSSPAQRREMIHVAASVAGNRPLAGRTYSLQRRRAYFALRTCKRVLALGADQSERVLRSRGDVLPVPGGVQGAAAAARPRGLPRHDRRARILSPAADRAGVAPLCVGTVRHDYGDPAIRVSRRLAGTHSLDLAAASDHLARSGYNLARSPDLDARAAYAVCDPLIRRDPECVPFTRICHGRASSRP